MHNDLLSIEFFLPDGAESTVEPALILKLAESIEATLSSILRLDTLPTFNDANPIRLYIASIRQGSIIIDFLPKLSKSVAKSFEDNAVGSVADSFSIVKDIVMVAMLTAVAIGLAHKETEEDPSRASSHLEIILSPLALHDPAVRSGLERMVKVTKESGANKVIIRFQDFPPCTVVDDGSMDIELIGSQRTSSTVPFGDVTGKLRLYHESIPYIPNPMNSTFNAASGNLHVGELTLSDGTFLRVLVEWLSRRNLPLRDSPSESGYQVQIKGNLQPLETNGYGRLLYKPDSPVSISLRRIDALLVVNAQIVEE